MFINSSTKGEIENVYIPIQVAIGGALCLTVL